MAQSFSTVETTHERLIIRLARRTNGGFKFLLAFVPAALLLIPAFAVLKFFYPSLFPGTPGRRAAPPHVHSHFPADVIVRIVAVLFLGALCLGAVLLILRSIVVRFGHGEIHVWGGQLRAYEKLGFLRLWGTRPIPTLIRLNVEPANGKPNAKYEMELRAFFVDLMPFRVAHHYDREQLEAAAKHLQSALPRFGAPAKIAIGGPPPLRRAAPGSVAPPPFIAPKPHRTRITLDRKPYGGVQFTVPGFPWWSALALAIVVALSLTHLLIKPTEPNVSFNLEALFPHAQKGIVDVVVLGLLGLAVPVIAFGISREVILFATDKELTMTTYGLFGPKLRKWAAADIDRLEVEIRTSRSGRGGSTSRSLAVISKTGRRQRYLTLQSDDELFWLKGELSAAIWPGRSSVEPVVEKKFALTPTSYRAPRFFGVLVCAVASIFIISGWSSAITQDHRLRHGQPVQATVTRVETFQRRGRSANYVTLIYYQYPAAGQWHESTEFLPTRMYGPVETELSDAMTRSLYKGSVTPAWYVDDDPSKAYLVHRRFFGPYESILFGSMFLMAGLAVVLPSKRQPKPGSINTDLTNLRARLSEAHRRRFIAWTWLILSTAPIVHYLLQWPGQWNADVLVITPIFMIISAGFIVWWRSASRQATSS